MNLDDRAAIAARARARSRRITLGEAVSELVLAGVEAQHGDTPPPDRRGLQFLPSVEGHVLTSEMVAEVLDDE